MLRAETRLEDAGVIRPMTVGRRNRVFEVSAVPEEFVSLLTADR